MFVSARTAAMVVTRSSITVQGWLTEGVLCQAGLDAGDRIVSRAGVWEVLPLTAAAAQRPKHLHQQ